MANQETFEVRIVDVGSIENQFAQKQVRESVSQKGKEFVQKWKGYVKVIYATASQQKIVSIEPIDGTPMEYYAGIGIDKIPVF